MELSEASFLEFLLHSVIDLCQLALAEEWPQAVSDQCVDQDEGHYSAVCAVEDCPRVGSDGGEGSA